MARRRTPTGLSGLLAIDKPERMTSHDVVYAIRKLTGEQRVGHAGTLDPLATGLLLVCVGPATRLAEYLMATAKTYEARISFGSATTTDDAEGELLRSSELPAGVNDAAFAEQTLAGLRGLLKQVPPAFSAIKRNGVTAYKAARAGEALCLEARPVELFDTTLLAVGAAYWDVRIVVSKGFYVRSFARDIGELLGSAAHLGALRRIASGAVDIEQASTLASLEAAGALPWIDPLAALGLPVYELSATQVRTVQNGGALEVAGGALTCATKDATRHTASCNHVSCAMQATNRHRSSDDFAPGGKANVFCVMYKDRLLALYETTGPHNSARPKVVIPGGVHILASKAQL